MNDYATLVYVISDDLLRTLKVNDDPQVHMVVTSDGKPIEFEFRAGSESDLSVLWEMKLDIPPSSKLFADGNHHTILLSS